MNENLLASIRQAINNCNDLISGLEAKTEAACGTMFDHEGRGCL